MDKYKIALEETSYIFNEHELDITGLSNAMDEWAKVVAIDFAIFLSKDGTCAPRKENGVIVWYYVNGDHFEKANTEHLYTLYLESK